MSTRQLVGPVVGVDVGGTKLLAVRLDPDGGVTADPSQASPTDGPGRRRGGRGRRPPAVRPRRGRRGGGGRPRIGGRHRRVRFAPNLPGLAGTQLIQALSDALPGWTVWVGNDATAACWAEYDRGAAQGADEVLMVTLGTGIGGGMVSGGRLIEGANRYAGEFGHMVVDPHGPRCPAGSEGCWERFASGQRAGGTGPRDGDRR